MKTPFFCMTQNFRVPPGTTAQPTLGPALDANCSIATRVDYVYRSNGTPASYKPLPSRTAYPADLAKHHDDPRSDRPLHRPRRDRDHQSGRSTRRRSCTIPSPDRRPPSPHRRRRGTVD